LFSLEIGHAEASDDVVQSLQLLASLPPSRIGDALAGLVALARDALAHEPAFVTGLDGVVQALDDGDFVLALPAMRAAFAWLPARERGELAQQVLRVHDAEHLSRRALTQPLQGGSPEAIATASLIEQRVLDLLAVWGVVDETIGELRP
jgi:hypothetical protein